MAAGIEKRKATRRHPQGSWHVRYRDADGRTRRKTCATKQEALDFQADVRHDKRTGEFIDPQKAKVRFAEIAEQWRAGLANDPKAKKPRKEKTIRTYETDLRVHVLPTFGRRAVGAVKYAEIDDWLRAMKGSGAAPGTIRNAYKVLKLVLDFARRRDHIRVSPCQDVTLPELEERAMLWLDTPGKIVALADAVAERYRPVIFFAAYTGLRAGEIAALRLNDVDWDAGVVRVRRSLSDVAGRLVETEPKSKKARRDVPVPAFVVDMLRPLRGDRVGDRYLFGTPEGKPFRHSNFYRRHFRPAVKKALPAAWHALRFHDLRHTYASLLCERGVHPKEMSELMGHSSVQITLDRYTHMMPHAGSAIAARLDEAYRDAKAERLPDNVVALR